LLATTNGGTTWAAQTSGTTNALNEIGCADSTHCWAVGASGTIRATSNGGTTWSGQTSGTASALGAVACPSTSNCWAAGATGLILTTTTGGTSWASQTSSTANTLNAVVCTDTNHCWAAGNTGTIVVYKITCSGGSLGLTAPSTISFAATLTGVDQAATANSTFTPDDETGSGAGWKISVYASAWSDGRGNTLPAPKATAASASTVTGSCSLPTSTVTYPTAGFGTSAPSATKIYNATAGTGSGPASVTLTFSQSVPANQKIGAGSPDSFSSTWTFTIASGP
jgi:hypothetical protein